MYKIIHKDKMTSDLTLVAYFVLFTYILIVATYCVGPKNACDSVNITKHNVT